jgi:hypothetical protein
MPGNNTGISLDRYLYLKTSKKAGFSLLSFFFFPTKSDSREWSNFFQYVGEMGEVGRCTEEGSGANNVYT